MPAAMAEANGHSNGALSAESLAIVSDGLAERAQHLLKTDPQLQVPLLLLVVTRHFA